MATISKYQTASGATLCRVRYRTPDRRSTQKRGFVTKRDAEAFAATVEVTKMRGESDVAAWVAELGAQRDRATVVMAYSVLARILDDAVRDRMLAANPAPGVKLPKPSPRRMVYLSADQLQRLADESGRYRSLVLLLGVRRPALG